MAKGLRSKTKRHFRTQKRETVAQAPWQLEAERKKQELMQAVIAGPTVNQQAAQSGEAGPANMEAEQPAAQPQAGGDAGMAVDGQPAEGGTKTPSKILKKIKKARLQAVKGVVKGKKKRANLQKQGAKAFLKKGKKR